MCTNTSLLFTQTNTDIKLNKTKTTFHSPKRAAISSALLPGLGQIYNKKYWKVPIIYAALGISGYAFVYNTREYNKLADEYNYRIENPDAEPKDYTNITTTNQLQEYATQHLTNKEWSVVFFIAFYALNIVDASVDAHFMNFDVNDDLSIHIEPYSARNFNTFQGGLSLTLNLK